MADDVKITIGGDPKPFQDVLQSVGESVTGLEEKLKVIAEVGAVLWEAVVAGGTLALEAFRKNQVASNDLSQAMAQNGIYTKELSDSYHEMAHELSEVTTYSETAIVKAQATAQAFFGQTPITKELTKAILDLAVAQNVDLSTAAEKIARTITTNTNVLIHYGIKVDEHLTQAEKQKIVLKAVEDRWGGLAEVQAQGLGQMGVLKNALEEIAEKLGSRLAPTMAILIGDLKAVAQNSKNASGPIEVMAKAFNLAAQSADFLYSVIEEVGIAIGATFGYLATAIEQLINKQFKAAYQTIVDGAKQRNSDLEAAWTAHQQRVISIQGAANKTMAASDKAYFKEVSDNRKAEIKDEAEKDKFRKAMYREYTDFKKSLGTEEGQAAMAVLNTVSSLQSAKSKELQVIGKAAAISTATINTFLGITQALGNLPPPISFVAAAAVATAGFVQVANIAGVQFAEGGLAEGGVPGVDSIPAMLQHGELVTPTQNFEEVIGSTRALREAEKLGGGMGGGEARIELSLKNNLVEFVELKILERQKLNISYLRST